MRATSTSVFRLSGRYSLPMNERSRRPSASRCSSGRVGVAKSSSSGLTRPVSKAPRIALRRRSPLMAAMMSVLPGAVEGAGSTAADAPDALTRRVRTANQATRSRDVGAPGNGCFAVATSCRCGQAADTPARGDELGATADAFVWHRDRGLCPQRRDAPGHRQYRGVADDSEDSRALREDRPGSVLA